MSGFTLHWLPGMSLGQVNNSSVSTNQNTRPCWSFSSHAPISRWACQQTSQQLRSLVANPVLVSEQRRLLMLALGWINSEPHCNRGWGNYCSYLRGIWHLKYTNRNDGYLMLGDPQQLIDWRCGIYHVFQECSITSHILSFFVCFSSFLFLLSFFCERSRVINKHPFPWDGTDTYYYYYLVGIFQQDMLCSYLSTFTTGFLILWNKCLNELESAKI